MKRVFIIMIFSGVIIVLIFLNQSESRENANEISENKLVIGHTEIFGVLERPQVVFDHGLHGKKLEKEGCKTCHPPDADGNLIFKYPFAVAQEDESTVKDAYHEKCISCHTKRIEEGRRYGPITCGGCHDRKRASLKVTYPAFDFDFAYHEQHVNKLERKCDPCHHIYDKEDKELVYEKGTEQSCFYCHDIDKKRGPVLAAEIDVTKRKRLTVKRVSHDLCVNCHLFYSQKHLKVGPTECAKCHTGKYRTTAQLVRVPRPDRDQPKKPLINVEGGMMKEVLFDHMSHEKSSRTCRACHHETLNACKKCHGLISRHEGGWVNVSSAYHDVFSEKGCAGCHNIKKSEKDCAGCHHHLLDMDIQAKGPKRAICTVCHSGKQRSAGLAEKIPLSILDTKKVPDKVTIKILEKQYQPSTFPHRKIIKKLIDISNKNRMAIVFHRNINTICQGCHHQSHAEAEAKKNKPPFCRNCHNISFDSQNLNRPRLLAVYHRQCLGCHEKMNLKSRGCTDCHKEKQKGGKGGF
ncbi:MAG: hypothetical protein FJ241_10225 [Nitrospira sp.]|nr:hypothetical protein [Nitrospira sp.]